MLLLPWVETSSTDAVFNLGLDVEDRSRLVTRLRQLTTEVWDRTAEHGEYSHYSVFIMFRPPVLHDFFHAYRIEELLLKRDWSALPMQ
jgi:hypothetical protein